MKSLKQDLEVEARLKRSLHADETGGHAAPKSDERAALGTTSESAARAVAGAPARPTSRSESLVEKIKHHRRAAALAAGALILLSLAILAYSFDGVKRGGEHVAASAAAIGSLAVLPFVNEGGDPNTEYLADGISDSVINSCACPN